MDYRIINHPKRPFIPFFSNMKTREPFNTWSHVFGAFASLFFIYLLFTHAQDRSPAGILALLIYGFSTFAMFSSSAIYHGFNGNDLQIKRLRMIDHMMIYVVIAGGYTPIAALVLPDNMGKYVLYGIWIIAGLGVLKKSLWMTAPSWFSTLLYVLMGWVSVLIFPVIWRETTPLFSYGIIIGGLFYSVGAIVYALKKPNILPKTVGFHGFWHVFVLGGALTHLMSHLYYFSSFLEK